MIYKRSADKKKKKNNTLGFCHFTFFIRKVASQMPFMKLDSAMLTVLKDQDKMAESGSRLCRPSRSP